MEQKRGKNNNNNNNNNVNSTSKSNAAMGMDTHKNNNIASSTHTHTHAHANHNSTHTKERKTTDRKSNTTDRVRCKPAQYIDAQSLEKPPRSRHLFDKFLIIGCVPTIRTNKRAWYGAYIRSLFF